MKRIKISSCVILYREDRQWILYNFIDRREMVLDRNGFDFLDNFREWIEIDHAYSIVRDNYPEECAKTALNHFLTAGALIQEGSKSSAVEERHVRTWEWSKPSAIFHNSITDRPVVSIGETAELQKAKQEKTPSPVLNTPNTDAAHKLPVWSNSQCLQTIINGRRTDRGSSLVPISIQVVADALKSSLGISGWINNGVCDLPLKPTPSGGGRNPYEAYILAVAVNGLDDGYYHYSATQHSLEYVGEREGDTGCDIMGGQEWADFVEKGGFLGGFMSSRSSSHHLFTLFAAQALPVF